MSSKKQPSESETSAHVNSIYHEEKVIQDPRWKKRDSQQLTFGQNTNAINSPQIIPGTRKSAMNTYGLDSPLMNNFKLATSESVQSMSNYNSVPQPMNIELMRHQLETEIEEEKEESPQAIKREFLKKGQKTTYNHAKSIEEGRIERSKSAQSLKSNSRKEYVSPYK